jgi:hypothetical protein
LPRKYRARTSATPNWNKRWTGHPTHNSMREFQTYSASTSRVGPTTFQTVIDKLFPDGYLWIDSTDFRDANLQPLPTRDYHSRKVVMSSATWRYPWRRFSLSTSRIFFIFKLIAMSTILGVQIYKSWLEILCKEKSNSHNLVVARSSLCFRQTLSTTAPTLLRESFAAMT